MAAKKKGTEHPIKFFMPHTEQDEDGFHPVARPETVMVVQEGKKFMLLYTGELQQLTSLTEREYPSEAKAIEAVDRFMASKDGSYDEKTAKRNAEALVEQREEDKADTKNALQRQREEERAEREARKKDEEE